MVLEFWVWAAPAPRDENTLVIGVSLTQLYHWWWNKIQIFDWDVKTPTPIMGDKVNQLLVVFYQGYDEPVICFAMQDLWWLMILGPIVFDDIHGCTALVRTLIRQRHYSVAVCFHGCCLTTRFDCSIFWSVCSCGILRFIRWVSVSTVLKGLCVWISVI